MDSDSVSVRAAESPIRDSNEDDGLPEEEPTSPKRSLATTACDMCKARKVRCDRAEPACGWCSRNNRTCIYRGRQKPGFRAGYVRELEAKINRLEMMLQVLGRRVESHIVVHGSSRELSAPLSDVGSLVDDQTRLDLVSFDTSPSVTGLDHRRTSMRSDEQQMQLYRSFEMMSVQSLMNNSASGAVIESASPSIVTESVTGGSIAVTEFPPYDQVYGLVDLYFKHVNTWCPILDRNATFETFFGPAPLDESDRLVLHAVIATSMRFSHDPFFTPEARKRYQDVARTKILLQAWDNVSIKVLQALVILALDYLGISEGFRGGNILALITRAAVQMRLHLENAVRLAEPVSSSLGRVHETVLPQPTSWLEEEGRRRLFWMIYILERYAAVSSSVDFVISEEEVDRPLPCRYDLFSKNQPVETRWFRGPGRGTTVFDHPENLGSFSYHCEVLRTLSRIHNFHRTPVDICSLAEINQWQQTYRELDDELNVWLTNLPDDYSRVSQLCHSDPTSKISNWIMLHSAFVTSVVRLHSCAAYPTVRSHLFTPSYSASQRCLAAVQSLREIAQDVLKTGMLPLLGPHFAFSLWVAARLLLVHAASTGNEVDPNCEFFIFILDQMGQQWSVARQYAQLLDIVWKRSREIRSPHGWTYSAPSSAPMALAAMRRRTYELSLSMTHHGSSSAGTGQGAVQLVSEEDLQCMELFDFFNYPRLPSATANSRSMYDTTTTPAMDAGGATGKEHFMIPNFGVAGVESDWSGYRHPSTGDAQRM